MKLSVRKVITKLSNVLLVTLCLAYLQVAVASNDNLLADPGFEQNVSAEQGGWIFFKDSNLSSDVARNGQQSLFNWGFSRPVPYQPFLLGTATGSYQELDAEPGSRWRMTGYAMTPAELEGTAIGIVQISFFDARGNDLGTVETAEVKGPRAKVSNQLNSKSPVGEWVFLDTGIATAPADAVKVHVFTLFVDYSGSEILQGAYFDDLTLCAIENGGCN